MPSHFDRFRFLNGGKRLRNEGSKAVFLYGYEADPPVEVPPGAEADIPLTPEGEALLDVPCDVEPI